jgi:hypothetical protein
MPAPKSLSIAKVSDAAKASVERAVKQHEAFRVTPPIRLGFVPPHWWFGFVLYDQNIDKITFGDARKLAQEIHKDVVGKVSDVEGGKAGAMLSDGYLTIGFVPPIEKFNLIEK